MLFNDALNFPILYGVCDELRRGGEMILAGETRGILRNAL
jgi:hypothetical protein